MKAMIKQLTMFIVLTLSFVNYVSAETTWIDVRSTEEYAQDHIPGDINIPHTDIVNQIEKHVSDKNTGIRLYCRSGKRAGIALEQLKKMGYTNVENIGGIADARALRDASSEPSHQLP